MKLLLDQGLPRTAAALLRSAGAEVLHVGELGMARSTDAEILDEARRRGLCVITLDADFHALLAISGALSPSVVRIRMQGVVAQVLVELLLRLWPQLADAVAHGSMITIDQRTVRIHELPLVGKAPAHRKRDAQDADGDP